MNNLLTYFKGLAMGAADVVPGVSGGTIAFITGILDK
ncbi:undecaprenyl phosphate translocase family protein, partial [Shewanella sp.]